MSRTSGLPLPRLLPYLFCYTDRDATEHLLRYATMALCWLQVCAVLTLARQADCLLVDSAVCLLCCLPVQSLVHAPVSKPSKSALLAVLWF